MLKRLILTLWNRWYGPDAECPICDLPYRVPGDIFDLTKCKSCKVSLLTAEEYRRKGDTFMLQALQSEWRRSEEKSLQFVA